MYTKEDVLRISEEYFLTDGYEVQYKTSSTISKDSINYSIIALGTVNDISSTSKVGKGFNKNQIRSLLGLSLFEIISLDTPCKLILPDSKLYRKQFGLIKKGINRLQVEAYYLNEVGIMTLIEK